MTKEEVRVAWDWTAAWVGVTVLMVVLLICVMEKPRTSPTKHPVATTATDH